MNEETNGYQINYPNQFSSTGGREAGNKIKIGNSALVWKYIEFNKWCIMYQETLIQDSRSP